MVIRTALLAVCSLAALAAAPVAQARWVDWHPRIAEVDQRLANQQARIAAGVAEGQISPWQARRDMARDARIARQLNAEVAWNGGYITPGEQYRLNRELSRDSAIIYDQRHF